MQADPVSDALPVIVRSFGCDEDLAASIIRKARHSRHAPKEVVLSGATLSDRIYLVVSGHARMLAISMDGRLTVIEDFREGAIFGEGALLEDAETSDDIVAVEMTAACSLDAPYVVTLMGTNAAVALAISRRLIARLNAQNRRFAERSSLSAAGRIHAEILRLAEAADDMTIRPAPVLSQMALSLQTTRETVSRTISQLENRGIISRSDGAMRVVAPHRLQELIY